MQRFSPWLEADVGWSDHELRLAIQADTCPTYTIDYKDEAPTSFRRSKPGWWIADVSVPMLIGTVRVRVALDGADIINTYDIVPSNALFGDDRDDMVRRLLSGLLAVHSQLPWGNGPAFRPTDVDISPHVEPSPFRFHLAAMDQLLPRLIGRLRHIASHPVRQVQAIRRSLHLDRVTRLDGPAMIRITRSPGLLRQLRGAPAAGPPARLTVPATGTRLHPVNLILGSGLLDLMRTLDRVIEALKVYEASVRGAARQLAMLIRSRMQQHRSTLDQEARRSPFWRNQPRSLHTPTPGEMQVIADDPIYSDAWRLLRQLKQPLPVLNPAGTTDGLLRPGFDLWEQYVWCRIWHALQRTLGASWQWSPLQIERTGSTVGPADDRFMVARSGRMTLKLGNQVAFTSASRYAAAGGDWSEGRFSLNLTRKPDVIIALYQDQRLIDWSVLDAKFSASCHQIEAKHLPAVHTYRDCLRLDGRAPSHAFIVVPALESSARCYTSTDFHQRFNTGAIVDDSLATDDLETATYRPITRWIEAWITTVSPD